MRVDKQICLGISNGAIVERVSRNKVKIGIAGDLIKPLPYEKLTLLFKIGRVTPRGLFKIIFDEVTKEVWVHFPHIVEREPANGEGKCGLDKDYTEAFTFCCSL